MTRFDAQAPMHKQPAVVPCQIASRCILEVARCIKRGCNLLHTSMCTIIGLGAGTELPPVPSLVPTRASCTISSSTLLRLACPAVLHGLSDLCLLNIA